MSENKQYENEHKVQAVKLAKKMGAVKAANKLQILVNTLYGWIRKVKIGSPAKKISVNSTTVIKNDIASGLKNSRSIFFTVYNKYRNLSSFFNSQSTEMERSRMEAD